MRRDGAMEAKECCLVRFDAADGLRIDGLLSRAGQSRTTIVHVHGKCGNFYQNEFISHMLRLYPARDVNFLSFNHRGHDCLAEGYWNGRVGYVGGSIEEFTESNLDIRAAVEYASRFSDRVILQGHSNGCEKVLFYCASSEVTHEVVLLSPSDSYQLHAWYIAPETGEAQGERIKAEY